MTGWHERPVATVPGFAARVILEQSPALLRRMREVELLWRGKGRPDLAEQMVLASAQLKVAARAWEDATGLPPTASVSGSAEAEASAGEGVSAPTDEISSEEASSMLKVSRRRIGQMVDERRLSGRKVGRSWVVDRASVVIELERRSAS